MDSRKGVQTWVKLMCGFAECLVVGRSVVPSFAFESRVMNTIGINTFWIPPCMLNRKGDRSPLHAEESHRVAKEDQQGT